MEVSVDSHWNEEDMSNLWERCQSIHCDNMPGMSYIVPLVRIS